MFSHLQDNHPEIYAELKAQRPSNQPTIGQVIDKRKKYDPGSRRAKLDQAIAYFLAKDMQPFHTIEKQVFQKMVHVFDSKYTLPLRNIFLRKKSLEGISEVRDNVDSPALTKASFYAVTTDLWTSCARYPFLSFTIDQHKSISDIVTQWGSTYQMMEKILEQQKTISAVLAEDHKSWHHKPTDQLWKLLLLF